MEIVMNILSCNDKEIQTNWHMRIQSLSRYQADCAMSLLQQISIPCEVKIKEEPISSDEEEGSQKAAEKTQPAWSILRDDFMMGAKMKDWNKESDSEESDPDT